MQKSNLFGPRNPASGAVFLRRLEGLSISQKHVVRQVEGVDNRFRMFDLGLPGKDNMSTERVNEQHFFQNGSKSFQTGTEVWDRGTDVRAGAFGVGQRCFPAEHGGRHTGGGEDAARSRNQTGAEPEAAPDRRGLLVWKHFQGRKRRPASVRHERA